MIKLALAVTVLSVAVAAQEIPLINLVPADAAVIGGIHVDKTAASPFGAFLLSQVHDGDSDFQQFISATGFDPRRDLREVVFASGAQAPGPGLVLARGVFNGPQLLQAAKGKTNGTISSYSGVDLLEYTQGRRTSGLAIINGSLAIAGNSTLVRAALDRRSGNPVAGPLTPQAQTASDTYDAWIVSNGQFSKTAPAVAATPNRRRSVIPGNAGQILQAVTQTSGGLVFGSVVHFDGQAIARSEKDAQALVDVARLATGLIQLNGSGNPDLLKLQPVLDSLKVTAQGTTVKFEASIAESDLENILQSGKNVRAASIR